MDNKTKIKISLITILGVFITYLYINRLQLIEAFKNSQWKKHEPKGQMVDGKKNGEWKTYFISGQLSNIKNYRNDTLHGVQISFYPDRQLKWKSYYNKGIKVGSSFFYHNNGQVNLEEYRDSIGRKQGVFKVYYSNGQISQLGRNIDGKFAGEFKTFYKTGQLKTLEYYNQGERIGTWYELSIEGDTVKIEKY